MHVCNGKEWDVNVAECDIRYECGMQQYNVCEVRIVRGEVYCNSNVL